LEEALQNLRADDVLVADAAVEEIVAAGGAASDSLLALLADARRDVRAGAIRGLGLLGEPRAVSPIAEILRSSLGRKEPDTFDDRYFRILAIQALGRLSASEEAPLLGKAARGDSFERAHAAVALFRIGDQAGEAMVRESLADTTMAIRNLIVEGLGETDLPIARELVLSATSDSTWVVRDTAFRALRRWRSEPAVQEAFARGASDPSWLVRATIAEAARP
jgi:HEAT repeat protein